MSRKLIVCLAISFALWIISIITLEGEVVVASTVATIICLWMLAIEEDK